MKIYYTTSKSPKKSKRSETLKDLDWWIWLTRKGYQNVIGCK